MNVLIVSEPGLDGVFRYVEALCHYLMERGIGVHFAYSDVRTCDRLPHLVEAVRRRGGRVVNLRTTNRPCLADFGALRSLLRLARETRPDVIHSHSSKAGALARMLPAFGVRAAQLYTPHAYFGMKPQAGRLDFVYNAAERFFARAGHTLVVSTGERDFGLVRLGVDRSRLRLLHNGIDAEAFSPAMPGEKRILRRRLGLPEDAPVLGFMGRSSAQKDPETLYRAFARAAEGTELRLFHTGRGELDGRLEALTDALGLRGRVIRHPYLSTPVDFYRAVDGFILTSRYEGLSLAALEALACNLPLILSRAPGNQDMLDEPLSHAWSAPPTDVEGFAQAIRAWSRRLGETPNHREIALTRYNARRKLADLVEFYREISGREAPAERLPFAMAR